MSKTKVDIINPQEGGLSAIGPVAQRLLQSNFNVNALRTQDILRKDEWKEYDKKIVEVSRSRLVAVGDLVSRGLTYNVSNALGKTKIEWEKVSFMGEADISMSGLAATENKRVTFNMDSIPLPLIHQDFQINARALAASRTTGDPLDMTQAAQAARAVSEKIESLLFAGSVIAGTTNKIYGYTTAPNRITGSTTASWASATGAQILSDVLSMIDDAQGNGNNMFGPYMLYVSTAAYTHMGSDYKDQSDKTILQRIKEVPGIIDIRATNDITDSNVALLVQLTEDVVDIINGIQPTMVMWPDQGGMVFNFKIIAMMIPRIKSSYDDQCGVVHYT